MLAEHFAHRLSQRAGKRHSGIDRNTLALLQSYDWPGNIRELHNVIERAVIMSEAGTLSVEVRWLAAAPRAASLPRRHRERSWRIRKQ